MTHYIIYTSNDAHVHSGGFACTQDELPTELARAAGIPHGKLIRYDVIPSREVAVDMAREWTRGVTQP
jgi:hypothetical protein|tara:strand:- start:1662 stop:1865 length:204 start_codon:yes stop_codon:yes gene_type:complete